MNENDKIASMTAVDADLERYSRQMRFAPIGEKGQHELMQSRALLVGCGALGSMIATTLVRAGVGALRIVDRDFVETSNLQRQFLFDEEDVRQRLPKAEAAKAKLAKINSKVQVEACVTDVTPGNIEQLAKGMSVILDGTDNFETRFLINDFCLKHRVPWVYGGCLGAEGQSMTIVPGETPCFRCVMRDAPAPGTSPTCDSAGIVAPIIGVIASIESMEAIKILSGAVSDIRRDLLIVDLWEGEQRSIKLDSLRNNRECPTCTGAEYPWLAGKHQSQTATLCGRNAVQLSFPGREFMSLDELARRLEGVGVIERNRFLLRLNIADRSITVFPDGRAIIGGTQDVSEARSLYARYIGA